MFKLTLVTPERKFVTDLDVAEVIVPGFRGQLDLLPGHAPLVTTLTPGILRYRAADDDNVVKMAVSWGYCQVSPTGVNVLAETAEFPEDIDKNKTRKTIEETEARLGNDRLSAEEIEKNQNLLKQEKVRLQLVNQ